MVEQSRNERGQALTLEGITAAIILLAAIGFALQMTAVTPLSASTSSQHVENQLQSTGEGVLASSDNTGALEEALLYWNESESQFQGAGEESYYRGTSPDNAFGDALDTSFRDRNVAYNVYIHYHRDDGTMSTQRLIDQGQPSDHAVSASRTVVLSESDRLVRPDGESGPQLAELSEGEFYAPHLDDESEGSLYNVVRVEVVAWRI